MRAGDRTALPALVAAARSKWLRWVGGGHYPTSTCHVRNVVEGILAAAERGAGGSAYFLTDGPPTESRQFVTALLATQGVPAPTGSLPRPVASAAATGCDQAWRLLPLPGEPRLTRTLLLDILSTCTVSDAKARAELGYVGGVSQEDGLAELRGEYGGRTSGVHGGLCDKGGIRVEKFMPLGWINRAPAGGGRPSLRTSKGAPTPTEPTP
ncbi:MAG TPA: hypothetical protein VLJ59_00700 [Mycobacteriales bacterium]|nr:hypothetical protein [Mycobacteriales bacterium]